MDEFSSFTEWLYVVSDWLYIVPEWLDKSVDYISSEWIPDGAPDWLVDLIEPYLPEFPHFYVQQNVCEKAFDVGILILTLIVLLFLVLIWRKYFSFNVGDKWICSECRAERSEILSEDLQNVERRVDLIKLTCQNISKKLQSSLQGQGTDGAAIDKRLKKMPGMQLSNCMSETSILFGDQSILGTVLGVCGNVEKLLSNELLEHQLDLEKSVIGPQVEVLDNDLPNIIKQKKHLAKLILDMDSARTRYQTAARHSLQTSAMTKAEVIKEEMDDASLRVEQCRDALAAEMFTLISKENELATQFSNLIKCQAEYHKKALNILETYSQHVDVEIRNFHLQPIYGKPLEEHLRVTDRQIALPIEACVCFLLECGMNEEGLFRVAGGSSKVKKLTAAFDANMIGVIDMNEYTKDPHAVAGALKSYLRNLPNPLLTHELYSEWMQAARINDADARLQALWVIVRKLPEAYFNNLRYLIKFMSRLSANQETTKMSQHNLALMLGPNLTWAPEDAGAMNMTMANAYSTIADHLISQSDWFFPGDVEFFISSPAPKSPYEGGFVSPGEMESLAANGDSESASNHSNSPQSGTSPKSLRRNKKPAPPVPAVLREKERERERPQPAERNSLNQENKKPPTPTTLERKRLTPTESIVPSSTPPPKLDHKPQIAEKPVIEKRSSAELSRATSTNHERDQPSTSESSSQQDVAETSSSDDLSPPTRRRVQSPSPADRFDHYRPEWYGSMDETPSPFAATTVDADEDPSLAFARSHAYSAEKSKSEETIPQRISEIPRGKESYELYPQTPDRNKTKASASNADIPAVTKPRRPSKPPTQQVEKKPERPDKPPQIAVKQQQQQQPQQPSLQPSPPQSQTPTPQITLDTPAEKIQSIKYTLVVGAKKETTPPICEEIPTRLHQGSVPGSPAAPRRPPRPQPPPPPPPLKG